MFTSDQLPAPRVGNQIPAKQGLKHEKGEISSSGKSRVGNQIPAKQGLKLVNPRQPILVLLVGNQIPAKQGLKPARRWRQSISETVGNQIPAKQGLKLAVIFVLLDSIFMWETKFQQNKD